jgi:hypothetical protein
MVMQIKGLVAVVQAVAALLILKVEMVAQA